MRVGASLVISQELPQCGQHTEGIFQYGSRMPSYQNIHIRSCIGLGPRSTRSWPQVTILEMAQQSPARNPNLRGCSIVCGARCARSTTHIAYKPTCIGCAGFLSSKATFHPQKIGGARDRSVPHALGGRWPGFDEHVNVGELRASTPSDPL